MSGSELTCALSGKAQELLAYLLLHRRSHPREKLATLLWQHGSTQRTKAYLRKALWQLRDALGSEAENAPSIVRADDDWIQINPEAPLWVDVMAFEAVFDAVRDCPASEMPREDIRALQEAETLYTGDLLENWYDEWCLMERERLRDMFLRMLGRLARCCEHSGAYDTGIQYGLRLLRIDPARERGHRQLMRLRARAGNRVAALRQYERCAEVLDRELGVAPATATRRLRDQIEADTFPGAGGEPEQEPRSRATTIDTVQEEDSHSSSGRATPAFKASSLQDGLTHLRELQSTLAAVQKQIRRKVKAAEFALSEGSE